MPNSATLMLAVLGLSTVCVAAGSDSVSFSNVTTAAGLESYHAAAGDGHGPGAVFTDLNGDGFPDLYVVRAWGDSANRLYVNIAGPGGTRVFERAANDGGAGDLGNATGAIAGDYDNDGDLDLYVTNFDQPNALYQSQFAQTGQLLFIDVTTTTVAPGAGQMGVGNATHEGILLDNSLTAAWGDPDRDGDLDLYVGNHNGWYSHPIEGPFDIPGRRDVFYTNNGDGTFTDTTMQYDVPGYRTEDGGIQTVNQRFSSTNAVIFADFNNDRWPDLFVTNKVGGPDDRDMLYMNRGANEADVWLGFELVTYDLVPTFGHRTGAAMGVDVADIDHDGDLDIYMTDFSNLKGGGSGRNDLWVSQFAQTGVLSFIHSDAFEALYSWGTQFQDFDHNGWEDLHVGAQAPVSDFLYLNHGTGSWTEVSQIAGVAQDKNSRGVVTADYNRDGWIDLFVVILDSLPSVLYENQTASEHPDRHFLSALLFGDADASGPLKSSRDALGARMIVVADIDGDGSIEDQERQIRDVVSGSSNATSTSSLELEFGLGASSQGAAEIHWPSGRTTVFTFVSDSFLILDEALLVPGDLDVNGAVDFNDLLALLSSWGPCVVSPGLCPADLNGDQVTGFSDLLVLLSNWGP